MAAVLAALTGGEWVAIGFGVFLLVGIVTGSVSWRITLLKRELEAERRRLRSVEDSLWAWRQWYEQQRPEAPKLDLIQPVPPSDPDDILAAERQTGRRIERSRVPE